MVKDEVVDQLACLECQSLAGPCPWDGGPLNNQPHIHLKKQYTVYLLGPNPLQNS